MMRYNPKIIQISSRKRGNFSHDSIRSRVRDEMAAAITKTVIEVILDKANLPAFFILIKY
jgi:hypothetical protein